MLIYNQAESMVAISNVVEVANSVGQIAMNVSELGQPAIINDTSLNNTTNLVTSIGIDVLDVSSQIVTEAQFLADQT